ncbi:hypothetical protein [Robbsia sp. KACC 23696]|uniref:hypothetical protein n=1 Tax=Robbsia sp. KACC 23696 TaxID=3149231 RepID=UPI00325BB3AA
MHQLRNAVWQSLPGTAYWSRLAHSVSVTGVMAGIAFGLWAAPTLAHWNTDPGLRSATLSVPARDASRPTGKTHWMRVADRNASGTVLSPLPHKASTGAPEHDFAVPRGDLRKDISDANRDAGPRPGFGGH